MWLFQYVLPCLAAATIPTTLVWLEIGWLTYSVPSIQRCLIFRSRTKEMGKEMDKEKAFILSLFTTSLCDSNWRHDSTTASCFFINCTPTVNNLSEYENVELPVPSLDSSTSSGWAQWPRVGESVARPCWWHTQMSRRTPGCSYPSQSAQSDNHYSWLNWLTLQVQTVTVPF